MNIVIVRFAEDFTPHRIFNASTSTPRKIIQNKFTNVTDFDERGSFTADGPIEGETLYYEFSVHPVED